MENLDHDVLENILFRLPIGKPSSQAKRVCKSWKTILDDRRHNEVGFLFACYYYNKDDYDDNKIQLYFGEEEYDRIDGNKIQLYFGEEEYDRIDGNTMNNYYSHETLMEMEHCRFSYKSFQQDILVGSCNGLVCIQKQEPVADGRDFLVEPFAICNPLTGEFIFLKDNLRRDEPKLFANGFGYCQSTKEYKVVRIYTLKQEGLYKSYARVYTIGSNKWRDIEISANYLFRESGIFANGVLHCLDGYEDGSGIVTFDLEDEKFRKLPLPPHEAYHERVINEIKLLGENLCWVDDNNTS